MPDDFWKMEVDETSAVLTTLLENEWLKQ